MLRKILFLTISLFILVSVSTLQAIQTKLGMEVWSRYTAQVYNGRWLGNNDAVYPDSYISIERGYFNVQPVISDYISGRFTIDIYSKRQTSKIYTTSTTVTNKGGSKSSVIDGAKSSDLDINPTRTGLKIKYAWLDFGMAEWFPLPDSKVTVGLMKHIFGTIYDWDYPLVEKALEDKYGFVKSADYGVSLNGYLPMGYGEYAISAYNGEGYERTGSDLDENPSVVGNLRITPYPGITIGGSYSIEKRRNKVDTTGIVNSGRGREVYAAIARINVYQPLDIWGEHLQQFTGAGGRDRASMLFGLLKLNPFIGIDLEVAARYDIIVTEAKNSGDKTSAILGINYNIVNDEKGSPILTAQLNYDKTQSFNEARKPVDTIYAQLKWKFSSTIEN